MYTIEDFKKVTHILTVKCRQVIKIGPKTREKINTGVGIGELLKIAKPYHRGEEVYKYQFTPGTIKLKAKGNYHE